MPALDNPRWERFAQAILEGLASCDRKPYSQGGAYMSAGYTAKDQGKRGGSAECAASRLLNRVKPIIDRVRELQAIAARNAAETAEKMARELNEIQYEARADKAHAAAVSAVLGKARILNITPEESAKPFDFHTSQLNARYRTQIAAIRWLQRARRCFDPGCDRSERCIHRSAAADSR